jgi:hypothetical protein
LVTGAVSTQQYSDVLQGCNPISSYFLERVS